MIKLDSLKFRGLLRKHTELAPLRRNQTRWSSTFNMLKRFFEIRKFIPQCLFDFIPAPGDEYKLEILLKDLNNIDSVAKALQDENISFLEARKLLDELAKDYPVLKSHIDPYSPVVKNPELESAIILVMSGKEELLSTAQRILLQPYLKTHDSQSLSTEVDINLSYAEKVLKRRRIEESCRTISTSKYINFAECVTPTSNVVERLFSQAKLVSTDRRKRLLPRTLESIMFLKYNRNLWNLQMFENLSEYISCEL
jgi:hypothetical protein